MPFSLLLMRPDPNMFDRISRSSEGDEALLVMSRF